MNNELTRQNNIMLRALLDMIGNPETLATNKKRMYHVQWIGGYAYGRTSKEDPFIILYSSNDKMNLKICRVYDYGFKKLPPCVDTNVPPRAQSDSMTKDTAMKKGLYIPCPVFSVIVVLGKPGETMTEHRFFDVLDVSDDAKRPLTSTKQPLKRQSPPPPPPTPLPTQNANTAQSTGGRDGIHTRPPNPTTWKQKAHDATNIDELTVCIAAEFYNHDAGKAQSVIKFIMNGAGYKPHSNYNMAMLVAVEGLVVELGRLADLGITKGHDDYILAWSEAKKKYKSEINNW